jgi:hypothetical protein
MRLLARWPLAIAPVAIVIATSPVGTWLAILPLAPLTRLRALRIGTRRARLGSLMRRTVWLPWRPQHLVAMRLLDWGARVFPLESVPPPLDVPCLLGVLELLSRVAMRPARSPGARACLARRRAIAMTFTLLPRLLRRVPQSPTREPLHLRVRMLLAQPLKRRHQFVAVGRSERSGKTAGKDRPVGVAGRH